MLESKLAPSVNGVIKIAKRSLMKFQFGEDEPAIVLDVIEISDMWHEINFALRVLQDEMWVLPSNKVNEFAINRLNFVQGVVNDAYASQHGDRLAPTLTRIEAEEFIRLVQEATDELRNFTSRKGDETSSAPENTEAGRGINFSQ